MSRLGRCIRRNGASGPGARAVAVVSALGVLLGGSPAASGSLGLATGDGLAGVTLAVDSKGDVLVTWSLDGAPDAVVVPARGLLTHSHALSGPDVSKAAPASGLPGAVSVRRTPDGTTWAVQVLQIGANAPVSLELSHWRGSPTAITLALDGSHLAGTVTLGGKPVTLSTFTNGGTPGRVYVMLDCFGCPQHPGWSALLGVAPKADGTFSVFLRPSWKGSRYRATISGPNTASSTASLAPDAQAVTP